MYDITVISGHVVFAFHAHPDKEESLTVRLYVWTIESLAKYWCPTNSVGNLEAVLMDDIPCSYSASDLIDIPYLTCRSASLSVHRHPFHDGLYKIWMLVTTYGGPFPYRDITSKVYQYSLLLDPSQPALLRLRTSFTVGGILGKYAPISYVGHTYVFRHGIVSGGVDLPDHQLILNVRDNGVDLKLPRSTDRIYLSTYSGALVYHAHAQGAIVVNYYK